MQEICEIHYEDHKPTESAEQVTEEPHVNRVVDATCVSLFARLAEIETSFDAKLDVMLELIKDGGSSTET